MERGWRGRSNAEGERRPIYPKPRVPDTVGLVHSTTTAGAADTTRATAGEAGPGPARGSAPESSAPVDGRSARWSHHRQERRAALANEARKAVHRLGPEVSMDEIATALGTSKSILYRYFSDKPGLQLAVGEVVLARMMTTLVEAAHTSTTPRESLRAVIGAYLEMVEGSPSVYSFVTQVPSVGGRDGGASVTPLNGFLDAVGARVVAPIAEALLGAGSAGSAQTWAAGVVGFVRGAGDRWLADGGTSGPDAASDPASDPGGVRDADRHALTDEVTAWLWTGIAGLALRRDVNPGPTPVVVDTAVDHVHHPQETP